MKRKYTRMKWISACVASCLIAIAAPLQAAGTESPSTTTAQSAQGSKGSYIFLQCAQEGRIEQVVDKPNTYLLTLKNVRPNISFITERPQRKTGVLPTERFMQEWNTKSADSLNAVPPNAFLYGLQDPKKEKGEVSTKTKSKVNNQPPPEPTVMNFAVQLSDPRFDAKTSTMTYVISGIEGRENTVSPVTLRYISLFIDNGPCIGCW